LRGPLLGGCEAAIFQFAGGVTNEFAEGPNGVVGGKNDNRLVNRRLTGGCSWGMHSPW